jgi:hypothetical protein
MQRMCVSSNRHDFRSDRHCSDAFENLEKRESRAHNIEIQSEFRVVPRTPLIMTISSYDIVDADDHWTGVDAWETPGIISAAEASEAAKCEERAKLKLKSVEDDHELIAKAAKAHLEEMSSLLEKRELSTVTRDEMKRLSKLDEEMKRLKLDLTASKSAIKTYSEEMIKSASRAKTYELMKTIKDRDIKAVIRVVGEAETVDLAFLLDCTSSMGSHIEAAKSNMKDIVRRVKRTNQGLKLRIAVVGYRDLTDAQQFEILDFTSSVEEFERFVSCLRPTGGRDEPENIAGAVQKANKLDWQQVSRVTFLIADAPCHGTRFHSCGDSYPAGTPGVCIETEMKKLLKQGHQIDMQLHFGRIDSSTDQMIRVFNDNCIEFDTCDLSDPGKLAMSVASSVRKSISKSVTASRSKSKTGGDLGLLDDDEYTKITDYTICAARPSTEEWKALKICSVKVLCNKPVTSIDDLKTPLHFGFIRLGKSSSAETEETKMLMRHSKDPFAEGEMRLAFYGKVGVDEDMLMSEKGNKVLKSFKKSGKSAVSERKRYLAQMEVSTIAQFLAEDYNKTRRPAHCPSIRFLSVHVVEDESASERYCVEDQLPCAATAFTKYSNNTGYWNEDEINQSLLLFTRFTLEKTAGYIMVTDLQGVRQGNEFILTDPALLCRDNTRFGNTNLGKKFIEKCMKATEAMLEEYDWTEEYDWAG